MKNRPTDKINKLILPTTIITASLILGGFFYASQVNKQRSIERQQEIKLQDERRVEEAKTEQEKKEYVAKRKNDCYSLYEKERAKWNNVASFEYSETKDVCIVKYKSDKPAKSKEDCEKMLVNYGAITDDWLREIIHEEYDDCLENWFSKEF